MVAKAIGYSSRPARASSNASLSIWREGRVFQSVPLSNWVHLIIIWKKFWSGPPELGWSCVRLRGWQPEGRRSAASWSCHSSPFFNVLIFLVGRFVVHPEEAGLLHVGYERHPVLHTIKRELLQVEISLKCKILQQFRQAAIRIHTTWGFDLTWLGEIFCLLCQWLASPGVGQSGRGSSKGLAKFCQIHLPQWWTREGPTLKWALNSCRL